MKREYKYTILNRTLKTKLGINYYYSVEVSCRCEGDTRHRIISTKSFNKNNPTSMTQARCWLKKMTETYG